MKPTEEDNEMIQEASDTSDIFNEWDAQFKDAYTVILTKSFQNLVNDNEELGQENTQLRKVVERINQHLKESKEKAESFDILMKRGETKIIEENKQLRKVVERVNQRLKDLDSKDDNKHFWVFVEGGATTANDDFRKELLQILGEKE